MQRAAKQFLLKFSLLAAVFYFITAAASFMFDQLIHWRAGQNPRERLLLDHSTDQAEIIVLGDSVFISTYVSSKNDSLGHLLQHRTRKKVFDGAMDGADSADFVNAARLVHRNGTKNATVILDIIPTRFLRRKHPEH